MAHTTPFPVPNAVDPDEQRDEQRMDDLRRIAEAGLERARLLKEQAEAGDFNPADLALEFCQVAKAVRVSIILKRRIARQGQKRQEEIAAKLAVAVDGPDSLQ